LLLPHMTRVDPGTSRAEADGEGAEEERLPCLAVFDLPLPKIVI